MPDLDHLQVVGFTESQLFRSMLSGTRGTPQPRDRIPHGQRLLAQLTVLARTSEEIAQRREAMALPRQGMTVALEISPTGYLNYQTLEWKREGVEVLNVSQQGDADLVLLFIPDGKLSALGNRVTQYLEQDTKGGAPWNAPLINVIENIRRAAFDELWTDIEAVPEHFDRRWFQLWLRELAGGAHVTHQQFANLARNFDIEVDTAFLRFPGRVVVAAYASRGALEQAFDLLDMLAEIRNVPPIADFFLATLNPAEQGDWVVNLKDRTHFPNIDTINSFVTLMDTGVNRGHHPRHVALCTACRTWTRVRRSLKGATPWPQRRDTSRNAPSATTPTRKRPHTTS